LRSLEELEDKDLLGVITSYIREMSWEIVSHDNPALRSVVYLKRTGKGPEPLFFANFDWEGEDAASDGEPRLFLLGETKDYGTSPAKMGLVSSEAQVGDCVCQVLAFEQALVVRHVMTFCEYSTHGLGIIGTAGLAENRFKARARMEADLKGASKFDIAHFDFILERVNLLIDVEMVHQLLN